jgi:hypothetical protein
VGTWQLFSPLAANTVVAVDASRQPFRRLGDRLAERARLDPEPVCRRAALVRPEAQSFLSSSLRLWQGQMLQWMPLGPESPTTCSTDAARESAAQYYVRVRAEHRSPPGLPAAAGMGDQWGQAPRIIGRATLSASNDSAAPIPLLRINRRSGAASNDAHPKKRCLSDWANDDDERAKKNPRLVPVTHPLTIWVGRTALGINGFPFAARFNRTNLTQPLLEVNHM